MEGSDKTKDIKMQMEYLRKMFKGCKKICVDFEKEDMNLNEKSCVERCAVKYTLVGEYVSKHYNKEMESMK